MNVQELMVGDWVLVRMNHTTDKYKEGDYLPHKVVVQRDWHKDTNEIELITIQNNSDQEDFIKPIPLTASILNKSGFSKYRLMGEQRHFTYCLGPQLDLLAIYDADFSFNIGSCARYVKYVHELQNILHVCKIEKEIVIE